MVITNGMFQEEPGSISSNIYWYHENKMTKLQYTLEGKSVNFFPPNEFIELLNKVAEIE